MLLAEVIEIKKQMVIFLEILINLVNEMPASAKRNIILGCQIYRLQ